VNISKDVCFDVTETYRILSVDRFAFKFSNVCDCVTAKPILLVAQWEWKQLFFFGGGRDGIEIYGDWWGEHTF